MTDAQLMELMAQNIVPTGSSGLWSVDRFDLAAPADVHGTPTPAGRYTSLRCLDYSDQGVGFMMRTWMSNVPSELSEALPFVKIAHGQVLVTGLGLGTILLGLVAKPEVKLVTVIEKNADVRRLVGPTFDAMDKVQIVPGDALTVDLAETFDCAWHDIWPTVDATNIEQMFKLRDRFYVTGEVMYWSVPGCRKQMQDAEDDGKLPRGTGAELLAALERRPGPR